MKKEDISRLDPADPKGGCAANRSKGNFHRIWRSWPIPAYKKKKPVTGYEKELIFFLFFFPCL